MSTAIDFGHEPDESYEREPSDEEMMTDAERMLATLTELRELVDPLYRDWPMTRKAWALFDRLENTLKQAIFQQAGCTACGLAWDACCCPVIDPFEDQ